jgi:hypothetical protein
VVGERRDQGGGDRSGSAGFDPAAGVRALADVQRRGLLAASELVDRLVHTVDGVSGDRGGRDGPNDEPPAPHESAAGNRGSTAPLGGGSLDDLVEAWLQLVRLGVDVIARVAGSASGGTGADRAGARATVDVGTERATGGVQLTIVLGEPPEPETAEADVWLHNGTGDAHAGVELHCGDLQAHDGAALPAAALRFDPPVVDLPARSSRAVAVSVTPRAGMTPGMYRGIIQATGVPAAWLPVEVAVSAASGRN